MGLIKTGILGLFIVYTVSLYLRSGKTDFEKLPNTWWGPGKEKQVDQSVRPFKVVFQDKDVEDLKLRLKNTRLAKPGLEGASWTYGVPSQALPKIIDFWLNKYDFKKRETYVNKYPQFVTNIQGLDIHFLHVKPKDAKGKKVLPLLLQHGWPGSVLEFYKIIPLLTNPKTEYDFVFEVIVPSLPGFGFSDPAVRPGLGGNEMAVVLKNLMLRLGFNKFYTQGGDWGAIITANMAAMFPQHVLGMHSNMCVVSSAWSTVKTYFFSFFPSLLLPEEDHHLMYPMGEHWSRKIEETGYLHIQATKPDTLGVAHSDSPIGLAAYILEKFSTGTNPNYRMRDDGGLFEKHTPDELIDNLMYYWIPNTMTTAVRIYAETFNKKMLKPGAHNAPINVPSACAQFRYEIAYQPECLLKERFKKLLRTTKFPKGGHFAAMEEPQLLAEDIWASVKIFEESKKKTSS
ncbi:juvenile hormone epoxide hydrolase 1-like [Leptopilina heterotoma]|uniref:juvenile hormone epoxide hydrolase 1-like n=1 Tax=Leptopilina heterotoma TaxID=63436 RepID=UPI001CAA0A72|nr:juvenile hormone epoxide hydrolase 1-like [Leptopilina heterotoma]